MTEPAYTEDTVELVARAIAAGNSNDPVFTAPRWSSARYESARDAYREQARAVLGELANGGLLLPVGAEPRVEYGVEHTYPGQEPIGLPATSRVAAERSVAVPGSNASRRVVERTVWVTPWRAVEDASDSSDRGMSG